MSGKKIRVYFDAFPLATGKLSGIGHLIVETVRALSEDDGFLRHYELVLVAPRSSKANISRLGLKNITFKPIPLKGRVWSALVLWRLLPPADMILGRGVYVFGNYTTWPLLWSKSITYVHDLNFLRHPETVQKKVRDVLQRNLPLWMRRSRQLVTISEFSKREIIDLFSVDKTRIEVIYCGVDHALFYPRSQAETAAITQKYGVTKPYLMFLSNVEPRKNIDRLLAAYEAAVADQSVSLLIVGADGWLNTATAATIERLRARGYEIIWPDAYVPDADLPALLSGAQALVHPALYEGFGISPLQAMACGTNVIVSNTTSLPEVAGKAGIYVDPLNTESITLAIRKALAAKGLQPKKKILAQAARFSWQKAAAELHDIIDNLLK
jgi:glycosyltransferase involved in cell wall biosynthesis